ncbi:type IV pilin [Methanolobus profundi]|uniref:Flagellin N-terminal-like domain-containing protein n=1 Tax=Methanolobus profundi TaxID=487685 RepID=A0A1I4PL99_9EURY|nr:type IV pilin [Methanolobus profundi]SFM28315.1 flagellin N-terminal-like domain-containing protein [Methanolobus profundi]
MVGYFKNSKALSPVIGTIMMVAVAVIFAAVIISAIGPDPLRSAPQADIRAVTDNIGSDTVIELIHQGGEELALTEARTKILVSGNSSIDGVVSFSKLATEADRKFVTGDSLYLYMAGGKVCIGNNTLPDADHIDIAQSGETLDINILDVNSQQMIADISARF